MGAVEMLIVWESLETQRYSLKNPSNGEEKVLILSPEQEKDQSQFREAETGVELEVLEKMQLTEWIVNNYKNFGALLEFVTNKSQEGSQFQRGFGGLGGLLRYKVAFEEYHEPVEDDDEFI